MNYSKWRKPDSNVMGCKGSYIYVTFWKRWTKRTVIWLPGFQQEMEGEREREHDGGGERDLNCCPINDSNVGTWASSINKMMLKTKLYIPFRGLNEPQGKMGSSLVLSPGRLSSLRSQEATYDRVFIFWKKKLIGLAFWSLNNKEGFELLGSLEG